MNAASIRPAEQTDRAVLFDLERRHFPAHRGMQHPGFAFDEPKRGSFILLPQVQAETMMMTTVAEVAGAVEGFAVVAPFRLPGQGQIDNANMLLNYLAVNDSHRRQGIGRLLLEETLRRVGNASRRQTVIVAHIPTGATNFYSAMGWQVLEPGEGFAWLPFGDFLRADLPDPDIGFDRIAVRLLRPNRLRTSFTFPRISGRPTLDAMRVLIEIVRRGEIDYRDLDEGTIEMLGHARRLGI